jgi:gamma-glutamyl:cysteine ligase YbdK (ATP-grasp superfamily)
MGQEIGKSGFSSAEFAEFHRRLKAETQLLSAWIENDHCSARGPITGFETEAWLLDADMAPAAMNSEFLAALHDDLASPELAKFNVEFNSVPLGLTGTALAGLEAELSLQWSNACATAESLGASLLAIGILPTIRDRDLTLGQLSPLNRYRALNQQVLAARQQQPIKLDIVGQEHLVSSHGDVMLEAAATSFQVHLQVPLAQVKDYYNAAILASAPLVGVAANSPFLFGKNLWAETRIPLFEQAVESGGYSGAARGPLHRVSFGTGYASHTIAEPFRENFDHFPALLPVCSDAQPEKFAHLRLHNGTIWRWNRPLLGFDPDGTPHIRIEHRVIPAGPSIPDMIANAALFYGLSASFAANRWHLDIPFPQAKDNFYQAARNGLDASVVDRRGNKLRLRAWILGELIAVAEAGLHHLGLHPADCARVLAIIEQRANGGQTGCHWQREFIRRHPGEFAAMTREYLLLQRAGIPVHGWPL